ncbi:cysteine desulfurase family protein [Murdochiella massiliensis]|uniref:cysteine desulfurase family protein n=1 Tax=Murdochiella massiliensis TaxID=1673723 RepID=UPI00082C30B7|nr:cysteine desulfurase family protein [Murdochiella massiliensis]
MIYFDNASTTPVLSDVANVVTDALQYQWGNPSSLHRLGFQAETAMEEARGRIAALLGVPANSLLFTSGATEGINMVMRSVLMQALQRQVGHAGRAECSDADRVGDASKANIVLTAVEHAAVHETAMLFSSFGFDVRFLPVDEEGKISLSDVERLVDEETLLVAVMHVNNELGTILPVDQVGKIIKNQSRALYLVDGTQALGKLPVQLSALPCDAYVASGHKIHAPKGIGLLYVRPGTTLLPLLTGGGQEKNRRSGTENVPYILGFAEALAQMEAHREGTYDPNVVAIAKRARERAKALPGVRINSPADGSPYILNFAVTGVKAEVLLHFMEQEEMYLSSGSACSKGKVSRILQEIHLPEEYLDGAIRLSFGRENREEEVDPFFAHLAFSIQQIRRITGGKA